MRANGQWVQRHTDSCTLNNGNAPGEYIYVKSTDTHKAPDAADAQDKTRDKKIAEYAKSKGWTRAADGGWNTNPGGIGWASNEKVGEEMDYVNSGRGDVQPLSLGFGPSEIKAYTPSWTERIEGSVQEGLISLGMDKYQAGEYGRKVGTLAGFVPGLGNSPSANDATRSFQSGQYLLGGVQTLGAIIGIGPGKPLAKGLEKGAEKLVQKEAEQAAAKALEEKAAKEAAEAAEAAGKKQAFEDGTKGIRSTKHYSEIQLSTAYEYNVDPKWVDESGKLRYPTAVNGYPDGFDGQIESTTLKPGTLIDRYGGPTGRFFSKPGTPFEQRAMALSNRFDNTPRMYKVVKEIPVQRGKIAPWFDQPGGGVQYLTEMGENQLVKEGYLEVIKDASN